MLDFVLISAILGLFALRIWLFNKSRYEDHDVQTTFFYIPRYNPDHKPISMEIIAPAVDDLVKMPGVNLLARGKVPHRAHVGDKGILYLNYLLDETRPKELQPSAADLDGKFLSVELMPLQGCKVKGAMVQQQPITQKKLHFAWECLFQEAGKFPFSLLVKEASQLIGSRSEFSVEVSQVGNLTRREISIIELLNGIAIFVLIFAELIHYMNW